MLETDPSALSWERLLLASATVLGLLALLAWALQFFAARGWIKKNSRTDARLGVISSIPLDARRRLVLTRCDDKEHLLLLGPSGDLLLSTQNTSSSASDSL